MTITVSTVTEVTITPKRIADLLCCGMEGGIGYWSCIIGYEDPPEKPEKSIWGDDKPFRHIDWPLSGGAVLIVEDADPEEREDGTWVDYDGEELTVRRLDMAALERGLKLMAEKAPRHFADFIGENEDAATGDVFIQFALLGDIVYA